MRGILVFKSYVLAVGVWGLHANSKPISRNRDGRLVLALYKWLQHSESESESESEHRQKKKELGFSW